MANRRSFCVIIAFYSLLHWKSGLLIIAQVLGRLLLQWRRNQPALRGKKRILASPNSWQQVCNRSNPEKTGRSCEGADFSWLSSKVSWTLLDSLTRFDSTRTWIGAPLKSQSQLHLINYVRLITNMLLLPPSINFTSGVNYGVMIRLRCQGNVIWSCFCHIDHT